MSGKNEAEELADTDAQMRLPFSAADRLTHLLLQQLFEGLLGLLLCAPFVDFLLKFWPFLFWGFDTKDKTNMINSFFEKGATN